MKKKVASVELKIEVVKVEIEGDESERKAEEAKIMKLTTDFGAKFVARREETNKTFLTFQTGDNGEVLKALLSN